MPTPKGVSTRVPRTTPRFGPRQSRFASSLATRQGRHIRIDIFPKLIPQAYQRVIEGLTALAAFGVSAALTGAALTLVLDERKAGTELVLDLPTWIAQVILPVGFLLIAFRFGLRAIEHFTKTETPRDKA